MECISSDNGFCLAAHSGGVGLFQLSTNLQPIISSFGVCPELYDYSENNIISIDCYMNEILILNLL